MAEYKDLVQQLQQDILQGDSENFNSSGFLNMNIPYDIKNPPEPTAFGIQIKTLVAQSIAIGVVKYLQENLPDQIPVFMETIFQNCEVKVVDSTGTELTGTIVYNPPAQ